MSRLSFVMLISILLLLKIQSVFAQESVRSCREIFAGVDGKSGLPAKAPSNKSAAAVSEKKAQPLTLDELNSRAQRFYRALDAINDSVVEGRFFTEALFLGMVGRFHIFISGPTGTGKTYVPSKTFSQIKMNSHPNPYGRLDGHGETSVSHVLGNEKFTQMVKDVQDRNVQDSPFSKPWVVWDEMGDTPTRTIRAVLQAILERQVRIGEKVYNLPLEIFVGATNKTINALFEKAKREGDESGPEAYLNRIPIILGTTTGFQSFMNTVGFIHSGGGRLEVGKIQHEDILAARALMDKIEVPQEVSAFLSVMRDRLHQKFQAYQREELERYETEVREGEVLPPLPYRQKNYISDRSVGDWKRFMQVLVLKNYLESGGTRPQRATLEDVKDMKWFTIQMGQTQNVAVLQKMLARAHDRSEQAELRDMVFELDSFNRIYEETLREYNSAFTKLASETQLQETEFVTLSQFREMETQQREDFAYNLLSDLTRVRPIVEEIQRKNIWDATGGDGAYIQFYNMRMAQYELLKTELEGIDLEAVVRRKQNSDQTAAPPKGQGKEEGDPKGPEIEPNGVAKENEPPKDEVVVKESSGEEKPGDGGVTVKVEPTGKEEVIDSSAVDTRFDPLQAKEPAALEEQPATESSKIATPVTKAWVKELVKSHIDSDADVIATGLGQQGEKVLALVSDPYVVLRIYSKEDLVRSASEEGNPLVKYESKKVHVDEQFTDYLSQNKLENVARVYGTGDLSTIFISYLDVLVVFKEQGGSYRLFSESQSRGEPAYWATPEDSRFSDQPRVYAKTGNEAEAMFTIGDFQTNASSLNKGHYIERFTVKRISADLHVTEHVVKLEKAWWELNDPKQLEEAQRLGANQQYGFAWDPTTSLFLLAIPGQGLIKFSFSETRAIPEGYIADYRTMNYQYSAEGLGLAAKDGQVVGFSKKNEEKNIRKNDVVIFDIATGEIQQVVTKNVPIEELNQSFPEGRTDFDDMWASFGSEPGHVFVFRRVNHHNTLSGDLRVFTLSAGSKNIVGDVVLPGDTTTPIVVDSRTLMSSDLEGLVLQKAE